MRGLDAGAAACALEQARDLPMLRAGWRELWLALVCFSRVPREERLQHGCKLDTEKSEAENAAGKRLK
jgi:hypothetical protein